MYFGISSNPINLIEILSNGLTNYKSLDVDTMATLVIESYKPSHNQGLIKASCCIKLLLLIGRITRLNVTNVNV